MLKGFPFKFARWIEVWQMQKEKKLSQIFQVWPNLNPTVYIVLPCSQHWGFVAAPALTGAHCTCLRLRTKRCLWATFLHSSCMYKWIAFWNAHDPTGIQTADALTWILLRARGGVRAEAAAQCPASLLLPYPESSIISKPGDLKKNEM